MPIVILACTTEWALKEKKNRAAIQNESLGARPPRMKLAIAISTKTASTAPPHRDVACSRKSVWPSRVEAN